MAAWPHRTRASRRLRASGKRGGGTCHRWQCLRPHRPVFEGPSCGSSQSLRQSREARQLGPNLWPLQRGARGHQNAPRATCNALALRLTGPGRFLAWTRKVPERPRLRTGSPGRAAGIIAARTALAPSAASSTRLSTRPNSQHCQELTPPP